MCPLLSILCILVHLERLWESSGYKKGCFRWCSLGPVSKLLFILCYPVFWDSPLDSKAYMCVFTGLLYTFGFVCITMSNKKGCFGCDLLCFSCPFLFERNVLRQTELDRKKTDKHGAYADEYRGQVAMGLLTLLLFYFLSYAYCEFIGRGSEIKRFEFYDSYIRNLLIKDSEEHNETG